MVVIPPCIPQVEPSLSVRGGCVPARPLCEAIIMAEPSSKGWPESCQLNSLNFQDKVLRTNYKSVRFDLLKIIKANLCHLPAGEYRSG